MHGSLSLYRGAKAWVGSKSEITARTERRGFLLLLGTATIVYIDLWCLLLRWLFVRSSDIHSGDQFVYYYFLRWMDRWARRTEEFDPFDIIFLAFSNFEHIGGEQV